jgi:hypothetical protein
LVLYSEVIEKSYFCKEKTNMTKTSTKEKTLIVLRWIAMLPAAVLGCIVAYEIVVVLNRLTMARYLDPNSFIARVFVQWIGHAIMGATFVYIAAYIAPAFRKQVVVVMAGLVLLLSGAFLFASIMTRNYWAMFGTVCMNVGSIAVAYELFKKETENTNNRIESDEE